ncbi:MAG: sugar phosphate nucleotidyltransferase [Candidatus Cloacimonetes bacterium]|nr:sugar phosphate nucleotidyltransferase [Candidatus Cloacimonadota bacterium]
MKAVIIAAGFGSRLWNISDKTPKTLLAYGKGTILSTIVKQLVAAGVTELGIVVGFNQQEIRDYLASHSFAIPISIIENLEWERGNAISVAKARVFVQGEPFILSMSDHLVRVQALQQIVRSNEQCSLLLTDPFIHDNFDIDDATKVLSERGHIIAIGKELENYNALDCGIFRLETDFFVAVDRALAKGIESISGAIAELMKGKRIKTVMLSAPKQWMDIDTPEAYDFANESFKL